MVLFYMLPRNFPLPHRQHFGRQNRKRSVLSSQTAMTFNALTSMQYAKIKARLNYMQIYAATFFAFWHGTFCSLVPTILQGFFWATMPIGMAFGLLLVNTNAWFLSSSPKQTRSRLRAADFKFFPRASLLRLSCLNLSSPLRIQGLFLLVSGFAVVVATVLFF